MNESNDNADSNISAYNLTAEANLSYYLCALEVICILKKIVTDFIICYIWAAILPAVSRWQRWVHTF